VPKSGGGHWISARRAAPSPWSSWAGLHDLQHGPQFQCAAILREAGESAFRSTVISRRRRARVQGHVWSHGQRILRAAHQIRRTRGIYSLYCSNYSCGADSFNLHFFAAIMEGKPFAIIETDGHSGDAGTKTRVEAFLHCVRMDLTAYDRRNCHP